MRELERASGRSIPEGDAEAAGWRYWSDGLGELHAFCPDCAVREFAPDAPAGERV
jgi:hypothetical protein